MIASAEDVANRYDYDPEGNVIHRWQFRDLARMRHEDFTDNQFEFGSHTLVEGTYRLVLVGVEVMNAGIGDPLTVKLESPTEGTFASANVSGLTSSHDRIDFLSMDFTLTNEVSSDVTVVFSYPGVPTPAVLEGTFVLQKLESLQALKWDHHNRLVGVREECQPDESTYSWSDSGFGAHSWDVQIEYTYDVFGNRIGKHAHEAAPGDEEEAYVPENGKTLMVFVDGILQRHNLYDPASGELANGNVVMYVYWFGWYCWSTRASTPCGEIGHPANRAKPGSRKGYCRNALLRQGIRNGLPGGIRTPDPRLRRPLLYPAELQAVAA